MAPRKSLQRRSAGAAGRASADRKSTRLNSSHEWSSYAVFCLKKKLRLSPLRRGLAIDSTVDIFTFYVPHRHVYGEQWIKFMKHGVNATPLPTVNTTGYIDHAAFLGTINPDTNKIPKHLFQGYLNIYNNYFKAPWMFFFNDTTPTEIYTLSLHDALPI